jgi:hypothetical protein
MSKTLTVQAAQDYLINWARFTAVRKTLTGPDHYEFHAKTYPMGEPIDVRVERGPVEVGNDWNIEQYSVDAEGNVNWSWIDAIPCTGGDEE